MHIVRVGRQAEGGAKRWVPLGVACVLVLIYALTNVIQVLDEVLLRTTGGLMGAGSPPAQPDWAQACTWFLALCAALYAMALGPRAPSRASGAWLVAFVCAAFVVQALLLWRGLWLPLAFPVGMLVLCLLGVWAVHQPVVVHARAHGGRPEHDRQRMHGLVLQGQGQLEQAFGLFRVLPTSPELLDNLCNLALDFERKRELTKARKVFKHVLKRDDTHGPARAGYQRVREIQHALVRARTPPAASATLPNAAGDMPATSSLEQSEGRLQANVQRPPTVHQRGQVMAVPMEHRATESVVYDAEPCVEHGASDGDTADFQPTVIEMPVPSGASARSGSLGVL